MFRLSRTFALLLMMGATARGQASQPVAPAGVKIQKEVAFLPAERDETLDLYLPTDRAAAVRSPAILIIHGGGWTSGDKAGDREFNIATNLARSGYVCASVNYKLYYDRWPTNLFDCKNAVRHLRKNAEQYQIDPERIGVIGGSAGGHLALMVAYTSDVKELEPKEPYPGVSDRVSAVVDLYGITDLMTRRRTDADGNPRNFVRTSALLPRTTADTHPDLWRLASPVYHVTEKSPPTLIIHGTADTTVDRDQASELAKTLTEKHVEHELMMLEGIGHTFDLQTWRGDPLPIDLRPTVVKFFDEHVKKATTPLADPLPKGEGVRK